jgi:hypothetical protein
MTDPFNDETPGVSKKLRVLGAGEDNPKVCTTGCEG